MKNIFKYLLIIAFASISFGAMADTDVLPVEQEVKLNGVRKYAIGELDNTDPLNPVITPKNPNSKFFWEVLNEAGTAPANTADYKVYLDAAKKTPLVIGADKPLDNVIYIEWLGAPGTKYRVKVTEKDKDTKCFDADINVYSQLVKIVENNFEVIAAWDKAESLTITSPSVAGKECAIWTDEIVDASATNLVSFKVSRIGGKSKSNWSFEYQYKLAIDTDWRTAELVKVDGDGVVDNDFVFVKIDKTKGLLTKDLIGTGIYKVEFRIVEAHDFYNTPAMNFDATWVTKRPDLATNLNTEIDINKIPAKQGLVID